MSQAASVSSIADPAIAITQWSTIRRGEPGRGRGTAVGETPPTDSRRGGGRDSTWCLARLGTDRIDAPREGLGRVVGDAVRFHEKDRANGKDLRVWGIRPEGEVFIAEQMPSSDDVAQAPFLSGRARWPVARAGPT